VRNAKAGQVQFRVDKAGIIHGTIGRRSFDDAKLKALKKERDASLAEIKKKYPATGGTTGGAGTPK